jgi:hypothetical protein
MVDRSSAAPSRRLGSDLVHAGVVGRGLSGELGEVAGQPEVAGVGQLRGPLGQA